MCVCIMRAEIKKNPIETVYVGVYVSGGLSTGLIEPHKEFLRKAKLFSADSTSKDWSWGAIGGGFGRVGHSDNLLVGAGMGYLGAFSLKGTIQDKQSADKTLKMTYNLEGLGGPMLFFSLGTPVGQHDSFHIFAGAAKRGARLFLEVKKAKDSKSLGSFTSEIEATGWTCGLRYIKPIFHWNLPLALMISYEMSGFFEKKTFVQGTNADGEVRQMPFLGLNGEAFAHTISMGLIYMF